MCDILPVLADFSRALQTTNVDMSFVASMQRDTLAKLEALRARGKHASNVDEFVGRVTEKVRERGQQMTADLARFHAPEAMDSGMHLVDEDEPDVSSSSSSLSLSSAPSSSLASDSTSSTIPSSSSSSFVSSSSSLSSRARTYVAAVPGSRKQPFTEQEKKEWKKKNRAAGSIAHELTRCSFDHTSGKDKRWLSTAFRQHTQAMVDNFNARYPDKVAREDRYARVFLYCFRTVV
jgi:hypothetical protein